MGVTIYGFVDSNSLAPNEKGETFSLLMVNVFTLGLKSIMSVALFPSIKGISLEYLSFVYEFTE